MLPLVNEANLAAEELSRDIKFQTKMVKRLDPFLKDGEMSKGKTDILVKVQNNEDDYFYEWPADKFHNRLYMIRELLEEFFDSGELPKQDKTLDPFWDPPNPVLIG
jgi:kinesin family protein 1